MPKKFWLVYSSDAPKSMQHFDSFAEAEEYARKAAAGIGETFYVLKTVIAYKFHGEVTKITME